MSHVILIYYSYFCFFYISAFPHQILYLAKQTNKQKCHIPFAEDSRPWLFHKAGWTVRDLVSSLCAKLVNILKALFEKKILCNFDQSIKSLPAWDWKRNILQCLCSSWIRGLSIYISQVLSADNKYSALQLVYNLPKFNYFNNFNFCSAGRIILLQAPKTQVLMQFIPRANVNH